MKRSRGVVAAVAVLAAGGLMPGCVIAVGSTTRSGVDRRMDRMEERLRAAEQKLGIPSPEVTQ